MSDQPNPTPNQNPPVFVSAVAAVRRARRSLALPAAILTGILDRSIVGRERYGTDLQAGNGRDAGRDCWEEALDAVMYATQAVIEAQTPGDRERWRAVQARALDLADAVAIARRLP